MTLIKELKSPIKIKKIYFKDLAFIIGYWLIFYLFADSVASQMKIPYFIFNGIVAIFLIMPSKWNPGKRMWQVILFLIKKDRNVYKPINIEERSVDFEE